MMGKGERGGEKRAGIGGEVTKNFFLSMTIAGSPLLGQSALEECIFKTIADAVR